MASCKPEEPRLTSLSEAALVLASVPGLSPPQILGAHAAILVVALRSSKEDRQLGKPPLWHSVLSSVKQCLEEESDINPRVVLLWFHAALRECLIDLECSTGSSEGLLQLLGLLLRPAPEGGSTLPALAKQCALREFEGVLRRVVEKGGGADCAALPWIVDISSLLVHLAVAPAGIPLITSGIPLGVDIGINVVDESTRCTACELLSTIMAYASASPSSSLSASVRASRSVVHLSHALCAAFSPEEKSNAAHARRRTLIMIVLPALFPVEKPSTDWLDYASALSELWQQLSRCALSHDPDDILDALAAGCLLIGFDAADAGVPESTLGTLWRHAVEPSLVWNLIELGLAGDLLARRRALHLLEAVVLISEHARSGVGQAPRTGDPVDEDWKSFISAFEIYETEFVFHLWVQVWPSLKRLSISAMAAVSTGANAGQCSWGAPLPPFTANWFQLLLEASLRSENPAVVKHGLELLFKEETLVLPDDPSTILSPLWIETVLVRTVLDNNKLYTDQTSADPIGGLVRKFFARYMTRPCLPASALSALVSGITGAVVGDDQGTGALKHQQAAFHVLAVFGEVFAVKDAPSSPSIAPPAIGDRLCNHVVDRLLGSQRFSCLNAHMKALALRSIVPLVTLCSDFGDDKGDKISFQVAAKFISILPRACLRDETIAEYGYGHNFRGLPGFLSLLRQWCFALFKDVSIAEAVSTFLHGDSEKSKVIMRPESLARFLVVQFDPSKSSWTEIEPVFGQVESLLQLKDVLSAKSLRMIVLLKSLCQVSTAQAGLPLACLRFRLFGREVDKGREVLGLSAIRLLASNISSRLSDSPAKLENTASNNSHIEFVLTLGSILRACFQGKNEDLSPHVRNEAGGVVLGLLQDSSESLSRLPGLFAMTTIRCLLDTGGDLVLAPEVDGSATNGVVLSESSASSLLALVVGAEVVHSSSRYRSEFLQSKWGSVARLAQRRHHSATAALCAETLCEMMATAAHEVETGNIAASGTDEISPLSLAYESASPVLLGLVAASSSVENRRVLFSSVAKAALDAFEDSSQYRPSVANSLAGLVFQVDFFANSSLLCVEGNVEGEGNLLAEMFDRFSVVASRSRPHILRAAVFRIVPCWRTHPQSVEHFLSTIKQLIVFNEKRVRLVELPSEGGPLIEGLLQAPFKISNGERPSDSTFEKSSSLSSVFVRVVVLMYVEGLVDANYSIVTLPWAMQLAQLLLEMMLDTKETPLNPMINTPAYGCRLRGSQALCVLVPLLKGAPVSTVSGFLDSVMKVLAQPVVHTIRFYLDLCLGRLFFFFPDLLTKKLCTELVDQNQTPQVMSSLVTVAAYISTTIINDTAVARHGLKDADLSRLSEIIYAVLPYVAYSSTYVRTAVQLLVHKITPVVYPSVSNAADESSSRAGDTRVTQVSSVDLNHLKRVWVYLDKNRDMVKLRKKQSTFLDKLQPILECRVGTMLIHGDEFNEISPQTLVDTVDNAMKELYNETCIEEGSAASAHPDITWPKGSEMAQKAAEAKQAQETAESTHVDGDNLQRKIQVWEHLELDLEEKRERGQPTKGRQAGLVVCASLVDKVPNLAGLTRTCEIFGASSMTLPSMQVVKSDAFAQISVTAEAWVDLQEVKPAELLDWLKTKRREGYTVVGLEQTTHSLPLTGPRAEPLPERMVLLLGKEKEGIPVWLLREVDLCVEIPQFGIVRSLNVHVSGAIAIWEYTRQQLLRQSMK